MNWWGAVVRISSVSAQSVRPPTRRTRGPGCASEPSSSRKTGFALLICAQLLGRGDRCAWASPDLMLRREPYAFCYKIAAPARLRPSAEELPTGGAHLVEAVAA